MTSKAEARATEQTSDPKAPASEADLLRTLGLARRARQLVLGTELVCEAMAKGNLRVVIEAGDTSANTHKRLTDKCATYQVPQLRLRADGETLAHALGRTGSLAAAGVTGELSTAVLAAWERLSMKNSDLE